jgi:signal transduction histidine kinase
MRCRPSEDAEAAAASREAASSEATHRVRSALSAVTMNLEFALEELATREDLRAVREALLDCRSASTRLLGAVSDLAAVARSPR